MAEEAAQAAAIKAYNDAFREYEENNGGSVAAHGAYHVEEDESAYRMSMEEQASMMLMEGLRNDFYHGTGNNRQDQQQQEMNDMLQMQDWMGIPGSTGADDATAQQLVLSILEEQRQQNAAFAVNEEEMQLRPEKHYFTISHDGTRLIVAFALELLVYTLVACNIQRLPFEPHSNSICLLLAFHRYYIGGN